VIDEDQIEFEQGQRRYLSTNIARCHGVDGASICSKCRRREPGAEFRQLWIAPGVDSTGRCYDAIWPIDWAERTKGNVNE